MPEGPTGRALQLLSLLQTHRLWRGAELAERLEVTERTVRRYVAWAQTGHFGPNSRQTDRTVTAQIRQYVRPIRASICADMGGGSARLSAPDAGSLDPIAAIHRSR